MNCRKCKQPMQSGRADGKPVWACIPCGVVIQATESTVSGRTPTQTPQKDKVSPPGPPGGKELILEPEKRSKYGNRKTEADGILFDSKKEADRYRELKLLEAARKIRELTLQPVYSLTVNGVVVGKYKADFAYMRAGGVVVEDVKGFKTPVYRLKKRIFEALYGKLTEV